MFSPTNLAKALAFATLLTSSLTLANPVGTSDIAAAKLDAEVGVSILGDEPNRCCTPGCEYCSTLLCVDVGCRDSFVSPYPALPCCSWPNIREESHADSDLIRSTLLAATTSSARRFSPRRSPKFTVESASISSRT